MSVLRARLEQLRGQAGAKPPATGNDLSAAISSRRSNPRAAGGNPGAGVLARLLGGQVLSAGVIEVSPATHEPQLWSSGGQLTGMRQAIEMFAVGRDLDPQRVLFLDTETTGLSGGTGTLAFMVGVARIQREQLQVRQFLLSSFGGEAALLDAVGAFAEGTTALVSYNGLSFDVPLLQTRYRMTGLQNPFAAAAHIDLLHHARRAFASRWPDCRLQTVERRLLGIERIGDLPGSEAPMAWLQWLRHGDHHLLARVLRHNQQDVISLARLLDKLGRLYHRPGNTGADIAGIARWHLRCARPDTAWHLLARHRGELDERGLLEFARLSRYRGQTQTAVALWQELAQRDCSQAVGKLAVHFEHQCRDYTAALRMTHRLIDLEGPTSAHLHRQQRLLGRLAASGEAPS